MKATKQFLSLGRCHPLQGKIFSSTNPPLNSFTNPSGVLSLSWSWIQSKWQLRLTITFFHKKDYVIVRSSWDCLTMALWHLFLFFSINLIETIQNSFLKTRCIFWIDVSCAYCFMKLLSNHLEKNTTWDLKIWLPENTVAENVVKVTIDLILRWVFTIFWVQGGQCKVYKIPIVF